MQVLLLLHCRINRHIQMFHSDYHFPFHRTRSVTYNENVIRALATFSFHFRKRFFLNTTNYSSSATKMVSRPPFIIM